jgi:hypothetical protein
MLPFWFGPPAGSTLNDLWHREQRTMSTELFLDGELLLDDRVSRLSLLLLFVLLSDLAIPTGEDCRPA